MKITRRQLNSLISESLLLESKYDQLMTALPELSLSVSGEGVAGGVALDLHDGSYLIASAILRELSSSGNPCIPNTMSISTIHVDASHQKSGVGEFLFDLIFYYASTLDGGEGYGITTDFEGGNTPIINYMIQRALQDPAYYKQRTSAGNDKMDFFGKTVDPDDDCYAEVFDDAGVYEFIYDMGYSEEEAYKEAGFTDGNFPLGTTSSWRKRGIESMKPVWKMLTQKQSPGTYTHPGSRMKQFRQAFDDSPTAAQEKNQKVVVDDYIQMRIPRILSLLNLEQRLIYRTPSQKKALRVNLITDSHR